MKKVFIKYNPYKLETELTVDGQNLAQNSQIGERIALGSRLQEWIEDLPKILVEEYNDKEFDINFHGTLLDYEDLTEVFTQAYNRQDLTYVRFNRIPAKETSDKEVLIDKVFKKIQQGPFKELKDEEVKNAFENAKSNNFEVCVVATMSAGKSTLINSLLGAKLMPSKQEACTAIITRIQDTKEGNSWQAEVYNKENRLIETNQNITYSDMERLNGDEKVSTIKIAGNIPFVSSDDVSLILIDTPGPNNSRDPEHKKIQSEFLSKSSKSLLLYIMEGNYGCDDDNALLQRVAESMKVGGKQSKDRFLFVVNKMDNRKTEDGDILQTLNRIREYLKGHGITNPNLFPAAALTALNIRMMKTCSDLDEDTIDETGVKVRKLNRNETLHLEKYASLPSNIKRNIENELADARGRREVNSEALIHTGIVSVEAAIRQYVQKYAKTAKIKNIVDTFMHKLEEAGSFEKAKQELAKHTENGKKIAEQINAIRGKVENIRSAKKYENSIDDALQKVRDDTNDVINSVTQKYQAKIRQRIDELRGKELDPDSAMAEVYRLQRYAEKLEPNFQTELDELVRENLIQTSNALLQEYKKKLASLTSEINLGALGSISIAPLKLVEGSIPNADEVSIDRFVQTRREEDGNEWVENTDKAWYKPWTWFEESGYYRRKYKDVKYVSVSDLAQEFFTPIKEDVLNNAELAQKHAAQESQKIVTIFNNQFGKLDGVLGEKLKELEKCATNEADAEKNIRKAEDRLNWLNEIKVNIASILDI